MLVVLLVLYVGSQLFSSLLMSVTTDKTQRTIMLALPFVFVLFVRTFPAGLLVYWITTNFWTVGQQCSSAAIGGARPADAVGRAAAAAERRPAEGAGRPARRRSVPPRGADGASPPAAAPSRARRPPGRPAAAARKKKRSGRRR